MASGPQPLPSDEAPRHRPYARYVIAIAVLLFVLLYSIGIIAGKVPPQRKLVGADVAILLVGVLLAAVLLQPEILDRLTHFKLGSLEFELQRLQSNQKNQQNELDDVRFALTLLLMDRERGHLSKLKSGDTRDYVGSHDLRTELRRLRTLGLIASLPDRAVSEIKDGQKIDLAGFVTLTERGNQYLAKLGDSDPDSVVSRPSLR
jgi:hypothetical protein